MIRTLSGRRLICTVTAVVCCWSAPTITRAEVRLHPEHAANRLDGLKVVRFAKGTLTLHAERPTNGQLVLTDGKWTGLIAEAKTWGATTCQFPDVVSASNAKTAIHRAWDKTLGYYYILELTVPAAGEVKIGLRSVTAAKAPFATTEAEIAAFQEEFSRRPSRFPNDTEGFRKWQKSYREKLAAWLMGGGLLARVPLEARLIKTQEFPKFALRRIEYRSQKDRKNTLLISLPKGVHQAPVLLALHGHEAPWGQANVESYSIGAPDDFCAYFAERGWAVLQPATMNHTLQHKNWTLQGEWSWDAMTALDYAATLPEVDMNRVAVCGLSTGGHLAMNVLALDDRVKAGVVGCQLSTWNHYLRRLICKHDCGILSQLGPNLEQCDWAALAAPKPVQYQQGIKDPVFCPGADTKYLALWFSIGVMPPAEYETMFAEVKRAYALAGKPANVMPKIHDGPHSVNNEAAFEWLNRWLNRAIHTVMPTKTPSPHFP